MSIQDDIEFARNTAPRKKLGRPPAIKEKQKIREMRALAPDLTWNQFSVFLERQGILTAGGKPFDPSYLSRVCTVADVIVEPVEEHTGSNLIAEPELALDYEDMHERIRVLEGTLKALIEELEPQIGTQAAKKLWRKLR